MQYLGEAGLRWERYRDFLLGLLSVQIEPFLRVRSVVAWLGDRRTRPPTTAAGHAELQHRALRHVSWRRRQAHVDLPTASTGAAAAGRRRCRGVLSTREQNWNLTKDALAAVLKVTGELPQAALDQLLERVGDHRLAAEDALQARLARGRGALGSWCATPC